MIDQNKPNLIDIIFYFKMNIFFSSLFVLIGSHNDNNNIKQFSEI